MPNIEVKLRRGTTAQHNSFQGAEGEVTVDTDKNTLVVHDDVTFGGHELLKGDNSNLDVGASAVVVNESGADVDFRVEGDANPNLLVCDAGSDRVIIGGTTPTENSVFSVLGNGASVVASIENANTGSGLSVLVVKGPNPIIQWEDTVGTGNATFNVGVDDNIFYFDDVTGAVVRALSIRKVGSNGVLNLPNIPTSATGLSSGDVWNNSGVLNIVP